MAVAARWRGRPRSFDYDEARRLRTGGATVAELCERFGVSEHAIRCAINETYRLKQNAKGAAISERKREPCRGGCGTLVWMHQPGRSGFCIRCSAIERTTTAREDTLQCARCDDWKPDDDFPRRTAAVARRGRAPICRPCETIARQERRERRKIPCEECGAPRLPAGEKGAREHDTGLCLSCYRESVRKAV